MSPAEQREAFEVALHEALDGACGLEIVQAVHEQLSAKIQEHRESKDPEPLSVTAQEIGGILRDCGTAEERISAFVDRCGERFGKDAALDPANLIESRRFEVKAADISISVPPEQSYQVEARTIEGKRYILIPAGEGIEVNGMPVDWPDADGQDPSE